MWQTALPRDSDPRPNNGYIPETVNEGTLVFLLSTFRATLVNSSLNFEHMKSYPSCHSNSMLLVIAHPIFDERQILTKGNSESRSCRIP